MHCSKYSIFVHHLLELKISMCNRRTGECFCNSHVLESWSVVSVLDVIFAGQDCSNRNEKNERNLHLDAVDDVCARIDDWRWNDMRDETTASFIVLLWTPVTGSAAWCMKGQGRDYVSAMILNILIFVNPNIMKLFWHCFDSIVANGYSQVGQEQ